MIEIFKGNTLLKVIEPTLPFNVGDELHIKVFELGATKTLYDNVLVINEEKTDVELEIAANITKAFPCKNLILDITLITKSGYVKTNQYKLIVKSRCIHGQN
jgi:hypothetical protein